jgi:hypothetical protein
MTAFKSSEEPIERGNGMMTEDRSRPTRVYRKPCLAAFGAMSDLTAGGTGLEAEGMDKGMDMQKP